MGLISFDKPNLLPDTIIRFASKAAVLAFTFDYVNYDSEIPLARPFFTAAGWNDFKVAISGTVNSIVQKQLFVYGVVSGQPIISNEGELADRGYVWRVQIPFLVTYEGSEKTETIKYYVVATIVQVPTSINPQGIGIDQLILGQDSHG
jgi:intracellular multiplication protein IcmL